MCGVFADVGDANRFGRRDKKVSARIEVEVGFD